MMLLMTQKVGKVVECRMFVNAQEEMCEMCECKYQDDDADLKLKKVDRVLLMRC